MFIRAEYNYDMAVASDETGTRNDDPSLTKQSFAEEADINTIVRRFGLSGQLPQDVRMPVNGDFTEVHDFQSAMNALVAARESFEAMPADVRARFHNDPAEFVDFCSLDSNRDEAIKLGLVPDPKEVAAAAEAARDARADEAADLERRVAARRPKAPLAPPSTGST